MKCRASLSAGFTVVELLVVLGITALILASAILVKPSLASARVNTAARSIASTLQLTRARAIATGADAVMQIDTVTREFGTANARHRLPYGMTVAVTVAESERIGSSGGIRYYPDGQSSGGEILLTLDGRAARIAVNWLTGEPRLTQ